MSDQHGTNDLRDLIQAINVASSRVQHAIADFETDAAEDSNATRAKLAELRDRLRDLNEALQRAAPATGLVGSEMLEGARLGGVIDNLPGVKELEQLVGNATTSLSRLVTKVEAVIRQLEDTAGQIARTVTAEVEQELEKSAVFLEHIANAVVAEIGKELAAIMALAGFLEVLVEKAFEALEEKLTETIKRELNEVFEIFRLIVELEKVLEHYGVRLGYVIDSVADFIVLIDPSQKPHDSPTKKKAAKLLDDAEHIIGFIVHLFIVYNPILKVIAILRNPTPDGIMSAMLPIRIRPDLLYEWIAQDGIHDDEREFRKELVATIDQYLRGRIGERGELALPTGTDYKTAISTVSEAISVVASSVIGFVLRHPKVPSLALPKLPFADKAAKARRAFDGAHIVSVGFGRSVSYTVKGALGTVGRGVWEINVYNEALVEGIVSIVASFIGSVLQSFLHGLLWLFEIREVYDDEAQLEHSWYSWKGVPETGAEVMWGVFARQHVLDAKEIEPVRDLVKKAETAGQPFTMLQSLLKSYGAYLDCIREYTDEPIADGTVRDELSFVPGHGPLDGSAKTLRVEVKSQWKQRIGACPVLRAYYGGHVMVMSLSDSDERSGTYECVFAEAEAGDTLHVRSNCGGTLAQAVA